MALTDAEKQAGKAFRAVCEDTLADLNQADPPDYVVPFFLAVLRHICSAKKGRSIAIECKERYLISPIYESEGVPAGRFGFVFREGFCRGCGHTARSRVGRVVDGWERPPVTGRVARS